MRKVTLDELKQLALDAKCGIWNVAKAYSRDPKIYLHWTAGGYRQTFSDYHINITGDGDIYSIGNLAMTLNHTWKRNSGSIGIALCCASGAGSRSLGNYPPTAKQIEAMAQAINVIATALDLTIDKERVMTHGEAANNEDGLHVHEPYAWWNDSYGDGDTRGDLEYLGTPESPSYNPYTTDGSRGGDILRGKANWYRQQSK